MSTGQATVDFGTGKTDTSVAVSAPTVTGATLVEAWVFPAATASNTVDSHWVEDLHVVAGNVVAGVGFTVYATCKTGRAFGVYNFGWASV